MWKIANGTKEIVGGGWSIIVALLPMHVSHSMFAIVIAVCVFTSVAVVYMWK